MRGTDISNEMRPRPGEQEGIRERERKSERRDEEGRRENRKDNMEIPIGQDEENKSDRTRW